MSGTATAMTTAPPKVGSKAPPLSLNTTDGKPWSLSDAVTRGPVVVCFMPGAFTGTCTKEMCNLSADAATFEKLGAQVVGVTVDSKHAQAAWATKEKITIPLVSDFEKKFVTSWGLAWTSPWGVTSKRATFVVDRSGTVQYGNVQANASEEPPYAEIQKAVKAAR